MHSDDRLFPCGCQQYVGYIFRNQPTGSLMDLFEVTMGCATSNNNIAVKNSTRNARDPLTQMCVVLKILTLNKQVITENNIAGASNFLLIPIFTTSFYESV